jgi:hypothetical protein
MTSDGSLVPLLGLLIGAGGPAIWPANVPWPLHQAVAEIGDELSRTHTLGIGSMDVVPAADLGLKVVGLNEAVNQLALDGELFWQDHGFFSCWTVEESRSHHYRRELMRVDATEATLVYRAARRWSALAAISLKNLRKAVASAGSTSLSGTPIRRQLSVLGLR